MEPTPDPLGAAPPAPRWVKISGLIAIVMVVAFAVLLLTRGPGGGGHGPGRHLGGDGRSTVTTTAPAGSRP